jgi:hypothetical protein
MNVLKLHSQTTIRTLLEAGAGQREIARVLSSGQTRRPAGVASRC